MVEEQQTDRPVTPEELRLFPLNVVLFPEMPLPLRVFEERYKLMISECLESEEPFGVVLIRSGREVGGPARPFEVGTTAHIVKVEKLEEGRMNLATVGVSRFQIVEQIQKVPYLKATVEYLHDDLTGMGEEVLKNARELFEQYTGNLAGLRGGWASQSQSPEDPTQLSYSIARYLDLPAVAQQRLLSVSQTADRLQFEIPLLEGANERLREQILKRNPYKGPRLN